MSFGIKRTPADKYFSDYVRELADYVCERCGDEYERGSIPGIELSHFWSRSNKSVRWDLENAAALCRNCHQYFTDHQVEHSEWFLDRLGNDAVKALERRARTPAKIDEKEVAAKYKQMLTDLKDSRRGLR